ncbi:MAG: hypothetical protein A3G34_10570 [Candidatus Lindowbacteria bacterium RIFCSPLOWO2_12_FULL_62_27]|nr:MAG: hypothetical protein A3G34_10570 [Candidatus Lindowbacteria bacterium RIFCSPLOWO2_12_FULL_62_27]
MLRMSGLKRQGSAIIVGIFGILSLPWIFLTTMDVARLGFDLALSLHGSREEGYQFGKFEIVGVPASDSVPIHNIPKASYYSSWPTHWDRPAVFDYGTAKDGRISFARSGSFSGQVDLAAISFRPAELRKHIKSGRKDAEVKHFGGEEFAPFRPIDLDGDGREEVIFQYDYDSLMEPTCMNISIYAVENNVPRQLFRKYCAVAPYKFVEDRKFPIIYNADMAGLGYGIDFNGGKARKVFLPVSVQIRSLLHDLSYWWIMFSISPAISWWVFKRSMRGRSVRSLLGLPATDADVVRKVAGVWVALVLLLIRLSYCHWALFGLVELNFFPLLIILFKTSGMIFRRYSRRPFPEIEQEEIRESAGPSIDELRQPYMGKMKEEGINMLPAILTAVWVVANGVFLFNALVSTPFQIFSDHFDTLQAQKSRNAFEVVGVPLDRPIKIFTPIDYSAGWARKADTDITKWDFSVDSNIHLPARRDERWNLNIWDRPQVFDYNSLVADKWISFGPKAVGSGTVPIHAVSFKSEGIQSWLDKGFKIYYPGEPGATIDMGDFDGDNITEIFMRYPGDHGIFSQSCWNETLYKVKDNIPHKIYDAVCLKYPHEVVSYGNNTYFVSRIDQEMGEARKIENGRLVQAEFPFGAKLIYTAKNLHPFWILCSFFPFFMLTSLQKWRFRGLGGQARGKFLLALGASIILSFSLFLFVQKPAIMFEIYNLNFGLATFLALYIFVRLGRINMKVTPAVMEITGIDEARRGDDVLPYTLEDFPIPEERVTVKWLRAVPFVLVNGATFGWPFFVFKGPIESFGLGILSIYVFHFIFAALFGRTTNFQFCKDGILYDGPTQRISVLWTNIVVLKRHRMANVGLWEIVHKNSQMSFSIHRHHPKAPMLAALCIRHGIPIDDSVQF